MMPSTDEVDPGGFLGGGIRVRDDSWVRKYDEVSEEIGRGT